ncbi:hypothetical protein [Methanogenium cariaci]|uniref:hypothetical protein n=1 Tax=Methanogenium cariaci TaxID=2197 RepID=UPI001FE14127|nr:hypothetical protein [Methanogenium cariaci]
MIIDEIHELAGSKRGGRSYPSPLNVWRHMPGGSSRGSVCLPPWEIQKRWPPF